MLFRSRDINFEKSFENKTEWHHWLKNFHAVRDGQIDTWDAQVVYLTFTQAMLSIYPARNLISNIGFREDATHTTSHGSVLANLKTDDLILPIRYPKFILPNHEAESDRKKIEGIGLKDVNRLLNRILNKLKIK